MLGPMLFIRDIKCIVNDLNVNVDGMIRAFADETTIGCTVVSEEGCPMLKQNFDQLGKRIKYGEV